MSDSSPSASTDHQSNYTELADDWKEGETRTVTIGAFKKGGN
jgi:hypothetical protein